MKKTISIICLFSILACSFISTVGATDIYDDIVSFGYINTGGSFKEPITYVDDESPVYFSYDENKFQQNEIIPIKLKLKEASEANISYVTDGFEIISTSEASYGVDIQLKYTSSGEEASFSAAVEIGEDTYSASLSAISTNKGIFIASNTDAAMDLYLYSGVEDGEYSFEKYTELFAAYCNRANNGSITTSSISAENSTLGLSSTTVSGSLTWIDDSNVSHPVQYNKVELYSCLALDDPTNDSNYVLYGTAYTNINGTYSFTIPANAIGTSIFLKIYAGNQHCSVTTWGGAPYVWQTTKKHNVSSGSNVTVNASITMSSSTGQAIQISQAVHVAAEYVKAMEGSYLPPVTVKYPHSNPDHGDSAYYQSQTNLIGIKTEYDEWDVIMHEYGHHVQHQFNITNSLGGTHRFDWDLAKKYNSKDYGIRLAWSEAYATVFGGTAQQYFASSLQNIDTVGDKYYYSTHELDYDNVSDRMGEANESSIIGILWDIYDTSNDEFDMISLSHQAFWNIITNSGATTFSAFMQYFYSQYPQYLDLIGESLEYHHIASTLVSYNASSRRLSWLPRGMDYADNDLFDIVIYNPSGTQIARYNGITDDEYIFSSSVVSSWQSSYSSIKIVLISYQTDSPTTGGYRYAPEIVTF